MADCTGLITSGASRNCEDLNASIGLERDLILVNYEDFDFEATSALTNRESDDTNNNVEGLSEIILKSGAIQYVFEGSDYSVVPTITSEIKEDGSSWFVHSLLFTIFSKKAKDRKTIETLGYGKVIAIAKDRSTGLYELFGMQHGLKLSATERAYVGAQNSNFYNVTIATPDIVVMRESSLGELALKITTGD